MSNYLKNFILLACSLLVSVGLMEVGVRVLNLHEPLVWRPHPVLGWVHVPGAKRHWTEEGNGLIKINDLGYRDKERAVKKPADIFRIGVFGDSQTEAVQVNLDQTFSYLLEEKLLADGYSVEVLNFGTNGYSPTQELLLLKKEINHYDLDMVVTALFLDNDVSGSVAELSVSTTGTPFIERASEELEFDFSQTESSYEGFNKQPIETLRQYSGLYRFLAKLKNDLQVQRCVENCAEDVFPVRYELYQQSPPPAWTVAWDIFERTLVELKVETDAKGIPLVLLSIPAGQMVNQESWQNILNENPAMNDKMWDLFGPEKRLADISNDLDIPLVQPYVEFSEDENKSAFYFGNVGHLTAIGHQEFTDDIFAVIASFITSP